MRIKLSSRTRKLSLAVALMAATSLFLSAQEKDDAALENVLKKMDAAAAGFTTTQADFVWDQYQKVVGETDTQKGTVYYRRSGDNIQMLAEIKQPDKKFVLYKDGKLQVYQPRIDQVTDYSTGGKRNEIESYLVLGFGGSGAELKNSFEVSYAGPETIDNISTAKLQLIPKSEKLRNNFPKILLWIDLSRGISLQQQFTQSQGDYRLARYFSVQVNTKIDNNVFRLKTTGKTQFVSPRG